MSVGWVSVSGVRKHSPNEEAKDGEEKASEEDDFGIDLRAWTPGGVGVRVRQPPLLPYAIRRRGERIVFLREYSGLPRDAEFAQFSPS